MSDSTPRAGTRRVKEPGGRSSAVPDPNGTDANDTDPEDEIDDESEEVTELDIEAPEADAQEQRAELRPHRDEPMTGTPPYDADPADATEQHRVVDLDEDDYRG